MEAARTVTDVSPHEFVKAYAAHLKRSGHEGLQTSPNNNTCCYNMLCSGFFQTNKELVLGGSLSPISNYGGDQQMLRILIWKRAVLDYAAVQAYGLTIDPLASLEKI